MVAECLRSSYFANCRVWRLTWDEFHPPQDKQEIVVWSQSFKWSLPFRRFHLRDLFLLLFLYSTQVLTVFATLKHTSSVCLRFQSWICFFIFRPSITSLQEEWVSGEVRSLSWSIWYYPVRNGTTSLAPRGCSLVRTCCLHTVSVLTRVNITQLVKGLFFFE